MRRRERVEQARRILESLRNLENQWKDIVDKKYTDPRREKFKCLEAQLATLRFLQSERRLAQQIYIALLSAFGGALVTLLAQRLL